MKTSMHRTEKYRKKLGWSMPPGGEGKYAASIPRRMEIEKLVKGMGIPAMLQFNYTTYAEQLVRILDKFKAESAQAEAKIKAEEWAARGLDTGWLIAIAEYLGLTVLPPPPPPGIFGDNSEYTNKNGRIGPILFAYKYPCPEEGTAQSISAKVAKTPAGNVKIKFALYDVAAGLPSDLLAYTGETTLTNDSLEWKTLNLTAPAAVHAQDYYIAVMASTQWALAVDFGSGTVKWKNIVYDGFPDPMGTILPGTTCRNAVYCTYIPD